MTVPTTDLTHTEITGTNAPVIPTLQSQAPESTFPANAWGYKVAGDNYNPVLLSNTNPSWNTDGPTNGTDHIIGLAAKVDGTKHSGTYTNTLTFNVVTNPNPLDDSTTFKLLYNANGGTGTTAYTEIGFGESGTIANSTFTPPENMVFAGWASTASGGGPYYEAGKPFIAPADATSGSYKILYAIWESNNAIPPEQKDLYVDSWSGQNYQGEGRDVRFLIQDMTSEICASATAINSEAYVLDIRDQTSYHIIKAADGRCWMQDNLALDAVASKTSLSSTNTNASDEAIANYTTSSGTAPNYGWSTSAVGVFLPVGITTQQPLQMVQNFKN